MSKAPFVVNVRVDLEPFRAALSALQQATRYMVWSFTRHRWQDGPQFWPPALRDLTHQPNLLNPTPQGETHVQAR